MYMYVYLFKDIPNIMIVGNTEYIDLFTLY